MRVANAVPGHGVYKSCPSFGYASYTVYYIPLYGMRKSLTENNVVNLAAISRVVTDNDDDDDGVDDEDKTLQAEAQEIARITIKWDTLSGTARWAEGGPCIYDALSSKSSKAKNLSKFL